ncbi:F420-dependent protein [Streptomonospora alba]|uniref:F420-dependent protein n=1 Tax=Streptomonospora alba TaxID=183763 RepID=A0A0C2J9W9_9ACTN|nr:PPOX class F420-dependent oxidoreductase [Streptomonospora alba]KIH98276.1 F420-dependent protein [Streptomonospora alba]
MASITDPRVRELLQEGTRTGTLAYTASDGRPLAAPVWFVLEGDEIVFNTGKATAKGKAIARDPRLALVVDDETPPYAFVQVQGVAEVSEDPDELLRTATTIAGRYMGEDRAEEYGRRNGVPGELVVRMGAAKVVTGFDMAD